MLLLTVTTDTQGRRRSDSCTAIDGELVTLAETNDCDRFEPTSPWPRSFQGLSSGALTTTAVVRDLPLSDADLRIAVRGYLEVHRMGRLDDADADADDMVAAWAAELKAAAGSFAPGTVLERWWEIVSARGSGPLGWRRPPGRWRAYW